MKQLKKEISRRSFMKVTTLASGGFLLAFQGALGLGNLDADTSEALDDTVNRLNGYVRIESDNLIYIMSPNPEGGQNVKTAMPMIVAEELDVDWANVRVIQAPLDTKLYSSQFIGGSQAIRQNWKRLRTAGATARQMLRLAAAKKWQVPVEEVTTSKGILIHEQTGKRLRYGEIAKDATKIEIPQNVTLKSIESFQIIGQSHKNVEVDKILRGEPLFGIDQTCEGMLIAMVVHPPSFGLKVKSVDSSRAQGMPGIKEIFTVKSMNDDYPRANFDTCAFLETVAVVGQTTWEVIQARKALLVEWEPFVTYKLRKDGSNDMITIPSGLESSVMHQNKFLEMENTKNQVRRKDGEPERALQLADKIIERVYRGPFLAHNCMEPMNFFAHVTSDSAVLSGPLQKAEFTEKALAARLGLPLEKIEFKMTRLGGGFGRRSYAHFALEAALISKKVGAPVNLVYTREDDMTAGIYRPAYSATYRASLDKDQQLTGIHIKAGGVNDSPLFANRFPAGAVENYLAEDWVLDSNITVGSFRAPRSNFIAAAEQSFFDELAEAAGKDPIDFRLELLTRAAQKPKGTPNEYDPKRYAEVLQLVREKSGWEEKKSNKNLGFSAYFCHDSYAAHVIELELDKGFPVIKNVCCAVDCGIVINPDAARNLIEGAIIDGIGAALFGEMTFRDGTPEKNNFSTYRMIRINEIPENIEIHFVKNSIDPTGLGEPAYPPIFAALANALYRATGKRFYNQPYINELSNL